MFTICLRRAICGTKIAILSIICLWSLRLVDKKQGYSNHFSTIGITGLKYIDKKCHGTNDVSSESCVFYLGLEYVVITEFAA